MQRSPWLIAAMALGVLGTAPLAADSVGFGLTVADDFEFVPSRQEAYETLFGQSVITPGFLVYFVEDSWGMSFDFAFDFFEPGPELDPFHPWWLDFAFLASYEQHLFPRFIFDPFVQVGGGMKLAAPITEEEPEEVYLAFHPVLGVGLHVNVGSLYARGSLQYQGFRLAIPAPDVRPYTGGPYRVMVSAGVAFE